ncbi:MAG: protein arginine kinase [Verrucomicrobia bacterium]|nr:protein arginine kinase [Verrucomicrobiota bacterium]
MTEKVNLPKTLVEHTPWETEINPIWLATSFLLHRNLAKFNFPPKMNDRQFQQTLSLLKDQILQSSLLQKPVLLSAEGVSALDKEFLYEHFLCLEGIQNTLSGQGFIVDESGHFLAELNIQNHLQLQLTDCQGKWENAWNTLSQIETAIGTAVDFAFSPKFGFLTAEPFLCGTGLTVQAYLHLPALIHMKQLEETLLKQKEEGISVAGMGGNLDEVTGDLIVVSNSYTLGINEESIIHSVHSMAMKLMAMEKTLRSHLQTENNAEIKDQVSRAFGLLLHSYQLQTKEALGALSLMKLGLHLDWIGGITDAKLNSLFFQCRRGHLLHTIGELQVSDLQEIAHKRADYLHKNMQGVVLKIEV